MNFKIRCHTIGVGLHLYFSIYPQQTLFEGGERKPKLCYNSESILDYSKARFITLGRLKIKEVGGVVMGHCLICISWFKTNLVFTANNSLFQSTLSRLMNR